MANPLSAGIKELRQDRNVSQEELAHRSGLSRTGMGFLETGKRWPRLDTLMSVAEGLNIPWSLRRDHSSPGRSCCLFSESWRR
jgi:transcriptional regulator with XRE-family HTH domain